MENQKQEGMDFVKFTWVIESFTKKNTKKLHSKSFQVGGCRWRILVHPIGKDVDHLSVCLKVADSLPPFGWTKFAYFGLALINHMDAHKSVVRETQRKFNAGYRSWGASFVNLSDFYDPNKGYLMKNVCIIEARISVSDVAFNISDKNFTIFPTPRTSFSDTTSAQDQGTECSDDTESSRMFETECSDQASQVTEAESQAHEDIIEMPPSDMIPSPNIEHYLPTAPPLYPSIYDDYEPDKEVPLINLSEILDFNSLGPEEAMFVPLLEEAISWYPSLIQSQMKKSPKFIHWAFVALGQVLYFLKTVKVKNMDEEACKNLQCLWDEVQLFRFDLTWLEPHVQSALEVKTYLERVEQVKNLRDNVMILEIEIKKVKARLALTGVDLEVARRDLREVQKGFIERDMDAELGYGMH